MIELFLIVNNRWGASDVAEPFARRNVERGGRRVVSTTFSSLPPTPLMPPSNPKPSDAERYQLGEWLACELQ